MPNSPTPNIKFYLDAIEVAKANENSLVQQLAIRLNAMAENARTAEEWLVATA